MKEHKTPLEYLKEHEGILPKTVGLAILCRLMEEYSDQQNAELRERVKELKAKQSALTSAMHDALSELVQCNYVKANILLYNALETTDEL